MRVYELARELKLDSSDVLAHAKKLKIDAKGASSGLEPAEAAKIKADAEAEAARMIAEAESRIEEIRENARNEGFEAGREEGLAKRYAEAGGPLGRLEKILRDMAGQ